MAATAGGLNFGHPSSRARTVSLGDHARALQIPQPWRHFARAVSCADIRPNRFRKPLLNPSELRGHGSGTVVHRIGLRESALALSKLLACVVATVLATVSTPQIGCPRSVSASSRRTKLQQSPGSRAAFSTPSANPEGLPTR